MSLFFKISDRELAKLRNLVFKKQGMPALKHNGFISSPNSRSLTRLSAPRGFIFAGFPKHKIRFFFSQTGLKNRLDELGRLLEHDLKNIDSFVHRWMGEHKPPLTDWNGRPIKRE